MRINHAAVIVSAIVYWLLGALWYGVFFAKDWAALEGITPEKMQHINPIAGYVVSFIANLIICYVLANLCTWRRVDSLSKGASLGVLIWIGFVATTTLTTYVFEGRPIHLFLINYGYCLVGFAIIGSILGAWTKKTV